MADNDRAILLSFDRPLSDDELRALHSSLRQQPSPPPASEAWAARNEPLDPCEVCGTTLDSSGHCWMCPPASEAWPTHPIEGVPVVGANVTEVTLGKPASEAGHREDSDEGLVKALGSAGYRDGDRGQFAPSDAYMRAQERLFARLRQLRAEVEAADKHVEILRGQVLEARADGERLREKNHAMAGERDRADHARRLLVVEIEERKRMHAEIAAQMEQDHQGRLQRAREEAAREERERCALIACRMCQLGDMPLVDGWHYLNEANAAARQGGAPCSGEAIRRQRPGAAGNAQGGNE